MYARRTNQLPTIPEHDTPQSVCGGKAVSDKSTSKYDPDRAAYVQSITSPHFIGLSSSDVITVICASYTSSLTEYLASLPKIAPAIIGGSMLSDFYDILIGCELYKLNIPTPNETYYDIPKCITQTGRSILIAMSAEGHFITPAGAGQSVMHIARVNNKLEHGVITFCSIPTHTTTGGKKKLTVYRDMDKPVKLVMCSFSSRSNGNVSKLN
jgi:hypothetical protein